MFRHNKYVYGDQTLKVPADLNLGSYLVECLWRNGDKIAMINGATHENLTYRELANDAMKLAVSLTLKGVKRGDVVGICSENRQEFFSTTIGIICTGATVTVTNMGYTKDEHKYVLNISKPKMMFCSPNAYKIHKKMLKTLPYLKQIIVFGTEQFPKTSLYTDLVKVRNDLSVDNFTAMDVNGQTDTAVILYSSGTTGLPKGVMLTHLNIIATCSLPSNSDPNELTLYITPWYHTMGLIGGLKVFSSGNTLVYLPKFDCDQYLQTIEKYKSDSNLRDIHQIVQLKVAPPVLVALSKYPVKYNVSSVRLALSGAAPLREETIQAVKARFPNLKHVLQGYGMTETTLGITEDRYSTASLSKVGGVGRIVSSIIIKIVDIETREPLGSNKTGEICVKGILLMKGYIGKDPSEDLDEEGFFKTGDIGYYDDDKYFFVVDRIKELIKYKGYQVPPAEIEGVLIQHPNIRDAGVVGIPDAKGGEVPIAFVVLQSGKFAREEEIKDFVAERLSNPKHLRGGVRFVDEIPKNPSGKILRKKLRELLKRKSKL